MGEYVIYRKQWVKIGTCNDLYYTTAHQFKTALQKKRITQEKDGTPPEIYLKENTFRFRFPFPDEKCDIGQYDPHDRGVLFQVPTGLATMNHNKCFVEYRNPAGNFGVNFPCPQDENFFKNPDIFYRHTDPKTVFSFEVTQQKIIGNRLQTVCRCPFCGASSRMTEDEIFLLLEHVNANAAHYTDLQRQILEIALNGYLTDFL